MFKRLCSTAVIFGAAALVPLTHVQTMTCLPRADLIEHLEALLRASGRRRPAKCATVA
ncbi:hypothetical protein rosmuc_00087 [Roseovarius mucosus DSM 17069]|uniref:Uncharacterized protein n=1 Tax=Roseovarius mucosus DSM 17069 TaxID=1288298 RepID=A0A0A0HRC2_9RHOB|nr:hypothetical protein rosmuc_00087 [Roseovarius mucosus DSM 17069]